MPDKRLFSLLLLVTVILIIEAGTAYACSCGSKGTVLEAYEAAEVVVIAKVATIEKRRTFFDEGTAKMLVQTVFKGDLKPGDEMTFVQGQNSNCIWSFAEEDTGKGFLFYLLPPSEAAKGWRASTCGRSNEVAWAGDDLLYLNKLETVRGKTRLSGTIGFYSKGGLPLGGRKVHITGAKKSYEVKTDEAGVYEIYDLPAGKYLVAIDPLPGWKPRWSRHPWDGGVRDEEQSPYRTTLILQDKKHAALDVLFEIDNAIGGTVYDANGRPMKDVCIKALPAGSEKAGGYHADCTERDGSFAITQLPRGSYVLVVNDDGEVSSEEPFGAFYYPNVTEREKAAVITIGAGDTLEGLDIHVPRMAETITIEGLFLYADGKPVIGEVVQFEAGETGPHIEGDAHATTDSKGRFSIKILKGLKGKLSGYMLTYAGEFMNCPKLERLIKAMGDNLPQIKTAEIDVDAVDDRYDVELIFPFPGCKKAK